jgi:hypothetical protein
MRLEETCSCGGQMVIEWDGYSLARPAWVAADVERWRKEHRGCPERVSTLAALAAKTERQRKLEEAAQRVIDYFEDETGQRPLEQCLVRLRDVLGGAS